MACPASYRTDNDVPPAEGMVEKMIVQHDGHAPFVSSSSTVAKDATICGNVSIGENTVVMNGARLIAEGGKIEVGNNCIILENAVLRSTTKHSLSIGDNVLIGPHTHVVGCIIENNVFVATGASVFHGSRLCEGSEVRINGTVHIKSVLPRGETIPIGWIGVGNPIAILPPGKPARPPCTLRPRKLVLWKPTRFAA